MSVGCSALLALGAGVASICAALTAVGLLALLDKFMSRNDEEIPTHSCDKCRKR